MSRWPAAVLRRRGVRASLQIVERLLQLRARERQAVERTLLLRPSAGQLTSRLLGPAYPFRTLAGALGHGEGVLEHARRLVEQHRVAQPHRALEEQALAIAA